MNTTDRFVRFAGKGRCRASLISANYGVQFRILPLRHSKAKAAPNLSRLRLNLAMTSPSAISTSRPLQPRHARASDAKFGLGNSMPCLFLVENGSKTGVSALQHRASRRSNTCRARRATTAFPMATGFRLALGRVLGGGGPTGIAPPAKGVVTIREQNRAKQVPPA